MVIVIVIITVIVIVISIIIIIIIAILSNVIFWHFDIWRLGHWRFGHSEIWTFGDLDIDARTTYVRLYSLRGVSDLQMVERRLRPTARASPRMSKSLCASLAKQRMINARGKLEICPLVPSIAQAIACWVGPVREVVWREMLVGGGVRRLRRLGHPPFVAANLG